MREIPKDLPPPPDPLGSVQPLPPDKFQYSASVDDAALPATQNQAGDISNIGARSAMLYVAVVLFASLFAYLIFSKKKAKKRKL